MKRKFDFWFALAVFAYAANLAFWAGWVIVKELSK
jgi:hypothetical protein